MKILFLNPGGGYRHEYPPLGLLYVASSMRKAAHEVAFFDEGGTPPKGVTLNGLVSEFKPRMIAVSLYTSNVLEAFRGIAILKKQNPEILVVVGGPHATVFPERTLAECMDIDYAVVGEGEITLRELIAAVKSQVSLADVQGICWRNGDGIRLNKPREFIKDLDTIPVPAYDLIQSYTYPYDSVKVGKRVATMMTSRGCPFECTFCAAKAVWGRSYRRRSPQNVAEEIKCLRDRFGYDDIYFMDDLFTANRPWLEEFYMEMKSQGISLPWKCLGRVDLLRAEDYKKMSENRCYAVQFGVESGDSDVLKDINKGITLGQAVYAFDAARAARLNTYAFFILGHRKDTQQTIAKTIRFARRLMPDFVSFFNLVPFPGTKLHQELPEEFKYNWERLVYTNWHADKLPIPLGSVAPSDLMAFEQQAYLEIYPTLGYFMKNILFSKAVKKLIRLKLWFVRFYLWRRMRLALGKGKLIDKITPSLRDDNAAFVEIWNEWLARPDIDSLIELHLKERKPFLDMVSRSVEELDAREVLEVGCGTAIDSHYLSKIHGRTTRFTAADLSPEAVEVARRVGKVMSSDIRLEVESAEKIPFEDERFDIVFSQGVMEHFRDPLPALKEQVRVLRKGGLLIVDVPQKYNPYTLYKKKRIAKGTWEYGWETAYSYKELLAMGKKLDLEAGEVGSHGYGYFQDYGFSLIPFILHRLAARKRGIASSLAAGSLRLLEKVERTFGHYFMQNITVVFRK
ncbi:MAG: cobalamin-dependent protein [bacterium]